MFLLFKTVTYYYAHTHNRSAKVQKNEGRTTSNLDGLNIIC